jgi:uncharacterized protein (TIGR03083 family)
MMTSVTSPEPTGPAPHAEPAPHDPQRPARLLQAEHDALLPILRRTPDAAFDRPTACPGWSVRDVLAHCSSALTMAATDTLHGFSPEENEVDVAERRAWPLADLLSELAEGYLQAGPAITAAGGRWDPLALGEWVHGGDVRAALAEPDAYASDGIDDACALLATLTRRRKVPLVEARLPDATLWFGTAQDGRDPAVLTTTVAAMIRLFAGRRPDPGSYQLTGATPEELRVFS